MDRNRGLLIFSFGCAVGMAAALMLKSKRGQDTVDYLRRKADEGARTLKDGVGNLGDAVTGAAARGAKAVKYQVENVSAAVDAGKKAFQNAQEMTP